MLIIVIIFTCEAHTHIFSPSSHEVPRLVVQEEISLAIPITRQGINFYRFIYLNGSFPLIKHTELVSIIESWNRIAFLAVQLKLKINDFLTFKGLILHFFLL